MPQKHVLIVEDHQDIASLIQMHLADMDCKVVHVADGLQGLKCAEQGAFDLIILDLMLPGMDGLEVCRRIRSQSHYTQILMLTSKSEELDRVLGLEVGADDFLSKPVDRTELLIRIRSLLRIKQYHDELYEKYIEISEINAKLKELEEYKEGLLQMIVHDLKNPLFAISANIDLLLFKKESLSEIQRSSLENCIGYCNDLNEIIQQLLDVHKIEQGKLKLNRKELNVTPMIKELLQQFESKAEAKKISVIYCNSHGLSTVMGDKGLIKRVVANLIDNGIRHTPECGKIEISAASITKSI